MSSPLDLIIHFASRYNDADASGACGIIAINRTTARCVQASGSYLAGIDNPDAAAWTALDRALDLAQSLEIERVELRSANRELVEQITGSRAVEPACESMHEMAMCRLLQLDDWQIKYDSEDTRAGELADQALACRGELDQLSTDDATRQQHVQHTGVPQWTVTLLEEPGPDCPARCRANQPYPFGPDTPAGLCVHAAQTALLEGPMAWSDPDQQRLTTVCPWCEVPIRIERVG
jgi:ribonuclease HI